MTFEELKLCIAIHRAKLGSRDRIYREDRLAGAAAVMCAWLQSYETTFFPFTIEDIHRWQLAIRKSKDARRKVEIAINHGFKCFWLNRGKGPCCDQAEAGHLVPRCRGGELTIENSIIECRNHNNQRRERTIEEYLKAVELVVV